MLMSCVVLYFLQGAHSLGLGLRVEEKPKTIGFLHQKPKTRFSFLRKSGFCLPRFQSNTGQYPRKLLTVGATVVGTTLQYL
jgi:hypothetical protein